MIAASRRRFAPAALALSLLAGLAGCTDSQVGSIPESTGPDPRTSGAAKESPPPAPGRAAEAGVESR